jgi:hypothetical protein
LPPVRTTANMALINPSKLIAARDKPRTGSEAAK